MILMMTGQGEKEESRGGENKESSGNVREKAGKKKDGKRRSMQQKEDNWVSGEGLSGGKTVEDNKSREKEKTVDQKKKDDRRQTKGKRVNGEGVPGGKTVEVNDRRERGHSVQQERTFADVGSQGKTRKARLLWGIPSLGKWIKL